MSTSDARAAEIALLMGRVGLGDRAAFARLYALTSAHLFAVVLRITRDRAQAEELLQDIYVNVWRAAGSFDAALAQPQTWLTSIARHRAIDSLRRARTEVSTASTAARGDGEDARDLLEDIAGDGLSPLDLLQRAAEARAVVHCIAALNAEQQQCVALAYYQGLSHSEVADHMAQPLGTVKSWLRRALLSLRDCLTRAGREV